MSQKFCTFAMFFLHTHTHIYIYTYANKFFLQYCILSLSFSHTHINTHKYIYIYIYICMSQKFYHSLQTYLLYSSIFSKSSQAFKIEAMMLHRLKPPFCLFFDPLLILVLVLQGKELLHWNFYFSVTEALWAQEVSHWSEQEIIRRS